MEDNITPTTLLTLNIPLHVDSSGPHHILQHFNYDFPPRGDLATEYTTYTYLTGVFQDC